MATHPTINRSQSSKNLSDWFFLVFDFSIAKMCEVETQTVLNIIPHLRLPEAPATQKFFSVLHRFKMKGDTGRLTNLSNLSFHVGAAAGQGWPERTVVGWGCMYFVFFFEDCGGLRRNAFWYNGFLGQGGQIRWFVIVSCEYVFLPVGELRVGSERAGAGWVLRAAIDSMWKQMRSEAENRAEQIKV